MPVCPSLAGNLVGFVGTLGQRLRDEDEGPLREPEVPLDLQRQRPTVFVVATPSTRLAGVAVRGRGGANYGNHQRSFHPYKGKENVNQRQTGTKLVNNEQLCGYFSMTDRHNPVRNDVSGYPLCITHYGELIENSIRLLKTVRHAIKLSTMRSTKSAQILH